jgi:single-strand DNA-binding protein
MFETHLTVVGTLITPVNRRWLPDGAAVANFRVASNERRYDRATETWTDGDSLYVSVTCWRQLAENVHLSFTIGDPIIVRGRLHTRTYDDKEGKRQTITELEANAVGPDLARASAKVTRLRRDGSAAAPATSPAGTTEASGGGRSDDPWADADKPADELAQDSVQYRETAVEAGVGA